MNRDLLREIVDVLCYQQDVLSGLLRQLSPEGQKKALERVPPYLSERIAGLLVELRREVGDPKL
jgi:hypothetical protein